MVNDTNIKTPKSSEDGTRVFPEMTTLDSKEIGVTLKISEETLRKLDKIQEETVKAGQEIQKFSWR